MGFDFRLEEAEVVEALFDFCAEDCGAALYGSQLSGEVASGFGPGQAGSHF